MSSFLRPDLSDSSLEMLKADKAKSGPGEKESGKKNYGIAYMFRGDFGGEKGGEGAFLPSQKEGFVPLEGSASRQRIMGNTWHLRCAYSR